MRLNVVPVPIYVGFDGNDLVILMPNGFHVYAKPYKAILHAEDLN